MILGGLTLILNRISLGYPEVVDQVYFRGIFQWIRWCYDHLLGWLPVPMLYVFTIGFIFFTGRIFTSMIDDIKARRIKRALHNVGLDLLALFGGVLFFFIPCGAIIIIGQISILS